MKLFAGMDSESELGSDMEEEALVVTKSVDVDKLSIEERIELVQEVQQSRESVYFYVLGGDRGLEVRLCMIRVCLPTVLLPAVRMGGWVDGWVYV